MSAINPPLAVEEMTTDWLQSAMAPHLNGATLKTFTSAIIGIGEGFMGQLARVQLEYDGEPSGAPSSIIAKFAATRQDTRDQAAEQNLYIRELGFYRDIG